ncbi:transaldolase [Helicobacter didelphidarum]|uniref:Transaldolase n=1 Tax=Helicobacter didelphidarum TaxID=2040648 RepID=A0A3D8IIV7_9HELI|nr:transaldolase [Helicobacter didelphidarum]RDU65267.1 transaldolase [Helicobacter didelphidarum]
MINIWCDFIERGFLEQEFKELIKNGVIQGATSNPSIFAHALKQQSYREEILNLQSAGKQPKEIYEILAIQDIKLASKILTPLYEKNQRQGLISIELDPFLCDDITKSIDEGVRLWREIDSPNVMIKVPATQSGYTIMESLMLRGININATLVFTKEQAQKVLQAFHNANTQAQGVISVFVSRFDREIDSKLPESLQGKYGIANAITIYNDFKLQNTNPNYRILFASTGVKEKNNVYNDDGYYVYPLAFQDCINTLPLHTLQQIDYSCLQGGAKSFDDMGIFTKIEDFGINRIMLENTLLQDGLKTFEKSFQDMLDSLKTT